MAERKGPVEDVLQTQITRRQLIQAGVTIPVGAALLAACGPTAPAVTTAPAITAAATTAAATTSGATAPATTAPPTASPTEQTDFTGVKLLAWSGGTTAGPGKTAAEMWKTEAGGEVTVEIIPFAERELRFAGLIAQQDASVDLVYGVGSFIGRFGDRLYEDLEALGFDKSPYLEGILPILSSGGKLRAAPMHSEMLIFIYNKTMFAKAGLDPATKPVSWDQLIDATPQLTEGNRFPCAVPWLFRTGGGSYWLCFYNSIPGAQLLSEDRTQLLFDNDNALRVWKTLEKAFKAKFFDPNIDATLDDYGTGKMFNEGKTASIMNFAELWGYAVGANPKDFPTTLKPEEVGVSVLPGIEPGTTGSINGFEGYGINKFSKNKAAALSYLKTMAGQAHQKQMNLSKVLPSSRKDVLTDPEVTAVYPVGSVLAQQGAGNTNRYAAPYDWTPPFDAAIAQLMKGEITAEQAHQQTIDGVKLIIQNYQVG